MKIVINGQQKEIQAATNLKFLIERFCKSPSRIIAELNGAVIKHPQWEGYCLKEGDVLELVNFVGGG